MLLLIVALNVKSPTGSELIPQCHDTVPNLERNKTNCQHCLMLLPDAVGIFVDLVSHDCLHICCSHCFSSWTSTTCMLPVFITHLSQALLFCG